MHIISEMEECQKMLPFRKPIKLLEMEQKLWNVINCPDSAGRRGQPCPFGLGLRKFANDSIIVIFFKNAKKITSGGLMILSLENFGLIPYF